MKKVVTISLAGVALVATLSVVAAGSLERESATAIDALPASEIITTILSMGLNPTTEPLRRGPFYVLHAYDPLGVEVRVVADAQLGDILSITPARSLVAYTPYYVRAPHIIHVPRRDRRLERHGDASPLPPPRSNALGAVPSLADGPTPIRPTPRFKAKADSGKKIDIPTTVPANALAAPPGDTPSVSPGGG